MVNLTLMIVIARSFMSAMFTLLWDQFLRVTGTRVYVKDKGTSTILLVCFVFCSNMTCIALGRCCSSTSSGCLSKKSKEHAGPAVSRSRP